MPSFNQIANIINSQSTKYIKIIILFNKKKSDIKTKDKTIKKLLKLNS